MATPLTEQHAVLPAGAGAPRAVIGLAEAVALIIGVVIGAGIFKAPSLVAGLTGRPAGCSRPGRWAA